MRADALSVPTGFAVTVSFRGRGPSKKKNVKPDGSADETGESESKERPRSLTYYWTGRCQEATGLFRSEREFNGSRRFFGRGALLIVFAIDS